jgi:hypothetical protein
MAEGAGSLQMIHPCGISHLGNTFGPRVLTGPRGSGRKLHASIRSTWFAQGTKSRGDVPRLNTLPPFSIWQRKIKSQSLCEPNSAESATPTERKPVKSEKYVEIQSSNFTAMPDKARSGGIEWLKHFNSFVN